MKRTVPLYLILIFAFSVSADSQQWQGNWSSSFGNINFIEKPINNQNALLVFGNYGQSGIIIGVSIEGTLRGVFYDLKNTQAGEVTFTQDEKSKFFSGKWKYTSKDKELSWNGSFVNHKKLENMQGIDRFRTLEGHWITNFGPLDLIQNEVFVEGKYSNKGRIYGVFNQTNNHFFGLFTNKDRYGLFDFILNSEKSKFDGVWSWKTKKWATQKWTGSKLELK